MNIENKFHDESLRNEPPAASACAGAFLPWPGAKEQLPSFHSTPHRHSSNSSRMNTYTRCSRNPFRMCRYRIPPAWGVSKIEISRPILGIARNREAILSSTPHETRLARRSQVAWWLWAALTARAKKKR
jgi:hypothetical protein